MPQTTNAQHETTFSETYPVGDGSMEYRVLGKTGLRVSVLGFGSSTFGNVYGRVTQADAVEVVDKALELGVNFFDSSPYYGSTVAEERLGATLLGKRHRVVLATKCGRNGVDDFDFSRKSIRRSVEGSLNRLQTDYVDLLQAHDVEFAHERQIVEETIPALHELRAEGKCRFVGITGYPVRLLRRIAEQAPVDTVLSYCRYAMLNTDMADVLAPLAERGLGLINASPLMMGVLTRDGPPSWHPAGDELKRAGQRAAKAARDHGCEIADVALQFSLQQNFAASTLIGMSTVDEVRHNVLTVRAKLSGEQVSEIQSAIGSGFVSTWPSGLAENAD